MLYGHVHNTWDEELMLEARALARRQIRHTREGTEYSLPCQMINCFCMYSDYTPLTLDEWIEVDAKRRPQSSRPALQAAAPRAGCL